MKLVNHPCVFDCSVRRDQNLDFDRTLHLRAHRGARVLRLHFLENLGQLGALVTLARRIRGKGARRLRDSQLLGFSTLM